MPISNVLLRLTGEPVHCGPQAAAAAYRRGAARVSALAHAAVLAAGLAGGLATILPTAVQAQTQQQPQVQPQPQQPPAVTPQAPAGQRFGDWVQRCTNDPPQGASPPPPGKQEVCFLLQQVLVENSQRPVLTITIGFFGPDRQALAVIDTQLRVPLAHGIHVGVDGAEVASTPFEFCHRDGCRAFLELNDQIVGAFKAGSMGAVQMRSSGGDPVNLPVSLKGFTAGYGSIQ